MEIKNSMLPSFKNLFTAVILGFSLFFFGVYSANALMTSDNFSIWADSVASGGNRSTSAGFIVTDTIGEAATGEDSASANFLIDAGLPAIFAEPILLAELSDDSVELIPDLSVGAVSAASYTLTVSTNNRGGYFAALTEDGNLRVGANDINDVADGEVTAGSEEYGVSVLGDDAAFVDDEAIAGAFLEIASRDDWVSESVTAVTHRAAVSVATNPGEYSHVVTYIVAADF